MSADYFRRMEQQCEDFLARARTDVARAQLRLWIIEFQSEAEAAERGEPNADMKRFPPISS
jgi:hypothetical protein